MANCKFILAAVVVATGQLAQPALAGQRTPVATEVGCIKTLLQDRSTRSGIATGILSKQVSVRRCNGEILKISSKNGKLKTTPSRRRPNKKPSWAGKGNVLPDGLVTSATKQIRQAWLTQPNRRYDHAILGDDIEAGGLLVKLFNQRKLEISLNIESVFEDRFARLVDLDGDGKLEIIVIKTYLVHGSAIAIYGIRNSKLVELAQSKPIGRTHRWLNPVAAADFDGDGKIELAWVETPHIGGTLKIARLTGTGTQRTLETIAELSGFSNHTIGSRELLQSVTFDWNGDGKMDIILPGARRQTLRVVSFAGGQLKIIDVMKIPGTITSPLIASDLDGNGRGEVLLVTNKNRLFSFSP